MLRPSTSCITRLLLTREYALAIRAGCGVVRSYTATRTWQGRVGTKQENGVDFGVKEGVRTERGGADGEEDAALVQELSMWER
jgi:hypothetical protein